MTIRTIQKFPGWLSAEVADFLGVTEAYVEQLRAELAETEQPK